MIAYLEVWLAFLECSTTDKNRSVGRRSRTQTLFSVGVGRPHFIQRIVGQKLNTCHTAASPDVITVFKGMPRRCSGHFRPPYRTVQCAVLRYIYDITRQRYAILRYTILQCTASTLHYVTLLLYAICTLHATQHCTNKLHYILLCSSPRYQVPRVDKDQSLLFRSTTVTVDFVLTEQGNVTWKSRFGLYESWTLRRN